MLGDIMFKPQKHNIFCRCDICKSKRRNSIFYLVLLIFLILIIFYQAFILLFITTKINAIILFIELIAFLFIVFQVIF